MAIINETTEKLKAGGYDLDIIGKYEERYQNDIEFGMQLLNNIVQQK